MADFGGGGGPGGIPLRIATGVDARECLGRGAALPFFPGGGGPGGGIPLPFFGCTALPITPGGGDTPEDAALPYFPGGGGPGGGAALPYFPGGGGPGGGLALLYFGAGRAACCQCLVSLEDPCKGL